jgi:hypothetical protein
MFFIIHAPEHIHYQFFNSTQLNSTQLNGFAYPPRQVVLNLEHEAMPISLSIVC